MIKPASPSSISFYFRFDCRSFTFFKRKVLVSSDFLNLTRTCRLFHSDPGTQINAGASTERTLESILHAVTSCSSLIFCQAIHARTIKLLNYNHGFIGDRLVSLYAKMGCYKNAQNLFDEIPSKDLVSWNSLISSFSQKGNVSKCLETFSTMRHIGIEPNEVTVISIISACTIDGALDQGKYIHGFAVKTDLSSKYKLVNALIYMYGKLGHVDLSGRLFDDMVKPNLVSWNSIITVQVHNGFYREAVDCFKAMRRDFFSPDQATIVLLLQACAGVGVGKLGDAMHGYIFSAGHNSDITILTTLLSFYAKSGRLNYSHVIFKEMNGPDRIAWTAMIAGYAVHGCGREAIELFEAMVKKGIKPDHVTFVHLLSACSHSGLVREGKKYFEKMGFVYKIEPRLDHYSCMVDILGRSGQLEDARAVIEAMPMEPNAGVWGALLSACKVYGNIEIGKEVGNRLFDLNPFDARNYLVVSNMYSAIGRWKDASKARCLMKERGVVRSPGCSFIEHKNKIHRFIAGDELHPDSKMIYLKLEEMIQKIREIGYVPKTEFVLQDVDDEVVKECIIGETYREIGFGIRSSGD